jgi:dynactin complex subunit
MQEMMMQRLKETLGASDEEWQALEPLVSEVMTARRDLMVGRMGRGRRGGDADTSFPEAAALSEVVEKEGATAEEIQAKLAAFRAAKDKKTEELKQAQEALKKVLTAKQEAALVLRGILD